ncbi:MAG: ClpXP protease specificity-enhancing factor [Halothiobacillaceae bacterium]
MTSSRPYLLRAIYQWIVDNDHVPHLIVNALHPEVAVPQDYAQDGQITLNISPSATRHLELENPHVSFEARFGGVPMQVYVPMAAVMGIVDRESGQGLMFPEEADDADYGDPMGDREPARGRPALRAVEGRDSGDSERRQTQQDGEDDDPEPPPRKPGLRIVK